MNISRVNKPLEFEEEEFTINLNGRELYLLCAAVGKCSSEQTIDYFEDHNVDTNDSRAAAGDEMYEIYKHLLSVANID